MEAFKKYAIRAPSATIAINDLNPEQGSSTIKYEWAVFMMLPSLIAETLSLLIKIVEICVANIFNLKLILAMATNGRGTINIKNKIGKANCLKYSFPKNKSTKPVITKIRENPEVKNICHRELTTWIKIPEIKKAQPNLLGWAFVLKIFSSLSQIRKMLIKGTKKPWL